jgi:hypothetical protein
MARAILQRLLRRQQRLVQLGQLAVELDGGREAGRQEQVRPLQLDHGAQHLVHDGLVFAAFPVVP